MSEPTITCPKCKTEFALNESLAAPLIEATRRDFEARLAAKDDAIAEREATIQREKAAIEAARAGIDTEVSKRLDAERMKIVAEETQKAQRTAALDLKAAQDQLADTNRLLAERETKLTEAQAAQADLLRARRELEDQKREMALTVEKQVEASLGAVRDKAKREAEEGLSLKLREREEVIAGMGRQIEDLKRKAEQGSQQLQGEVQELVIEDLIRERFPFDVVEPVAKGVHGGDCIHRVMGADGRPVGAILWEVKRTRNWSDAWLAKLRSDQREAKADIALIVSQTLPKGLANFDLMEGVWVAEPGCAIPVAVALRESMIALAGAQRAGEGQETKMAQVYAYLTGPRFKHHVEAIVEQFTAMRVDLDRERRLMTAQWKKRDGQITAVLTATAGLYGDLGAIAGQTLQEIEGLTMPLLDAPDE